MDRLCDEILQLILFELNDPSHLILASKRFHRLSQQPYVRAQYFLIRHGPTQAMFWALGRGKLMTEQVFDILLASGAHLSRYLVQVAIHHYFRTTSHFIKTAWVRTVPLPAFSHFIRLASRLYGEVPVGKGEDDGSVFNGFLKESRFPSSLKSISWEEIRDILVKYKFIPFSHKDPIMATFPLALSVEPRLLPFAVNNGFKMDKKYRDFVFRKMFEQPALPSETRADEIVRNVRELSRLDPMMFLSRTVAAEVCMEAKVNESGYTALKRLDKLGVLRFELPLLVEELIKLFIKTRSITTLYTVQVLRQLYTDFTSPDPTVRTVLLLTVFISDNCLAHTTPATFKSKLEPLGLLPLSRRDIYNVMINPFVDRYAPILAFARVEVGMNGKEVMELVEEVAVKCLEIGCKGRTLKKLLDGFSFLQDSIESVVPQRYQLELDDLPQPEDETACALYEAKLCRDYIIQKSHEETTNRAERQVDENGAVVGGGGADEESPEAEETDELADEVENTAERDNSELGRIGQDTLSAMIRQDELAPARARRRAYFGYPNYGDMAGKLRYPNDALQVGRWVKDQFGLRGRVTAVFMTHAIINDNNTILHHYLPYPENAPDGTSHHVPITLKHFKMLARLGRAPSYHLYHEIERGAEFFFSEEDYLVHQNGVDPKKKTRVKVEDINNGVLHASASASRSPPRGRKRSRRAAAATAPSYLIPDSDDEVIAEEDVNIISSSKNVTKKKVETNLQLWLKHLSILLKDEQRKYKEKKKRIEKATPGGLKVRVAKSDFLRSLSTNLRILRKREIVERIFLYGLDDDGDDDDDDDDEYHDKTKRRKIAKA